MIIVRIFFTAHLVCGLLGCSSVNNQWRHIPGPESPADLVILLRKDITNADLNSFSQNVLGKPRPDGRGPDLEAGIAETMYVERSGYKGFAVNFSPKITESERQNILHKIQASNEVYQIYEDVAPDSITDQTGVVGGSH